MSLDVEKGDFNIMGVEFVPFCSRMFFVTDSDKAHFDPSDLNDAEFDELSRRVHSTDDTEARTRLLDEFFLKRLSDLPINEVNIERMHDVFDEVVPTDGADACPPQYREEFSPADLAAIAHIGYKQFSRIFNDSVGLNPKAYLRLVRFHRALMELQKSGSGCSITEIAWRCGYYDLSHMTSEFRAICGYSPSELLNTESGLTEAFKPEFSGLMKKKIKIKNLI